ncbi:hypothetical protein CR513_40805, partial [Mucuna pruriens]
MFTVLEGYSKNVLAPCSKLDNICFKLGAPTLSLINITPDEAWSGIKQPIKHFRVFGSLAHVHFPNARRTKLEGNSYSYVLLGISEESKGHWLYDQVYKKIVIRQEVDKSYKEQVPLDIEWEDEERHNAYCNEESDEAPPIHEKGEIKEFEYKGETKKLVKAFLMKI